MFPRRSTVCVLSLASLAAFSFSAGYAQAQLASTAPTSTPQVLRSNANLVLEDVVVTDDDNPLNGLDRSRFHIFEDGVEQKIVSFDEHMAPAPSATPPRVEPFRLPPDTYTNIPLYPPAQATNVLLLDALNTLTTNQLDVRRQLLRSIGEVPAGTPLAIFALASRLRMIAGFTTNSDDLIRAIKSPQAVQQSDVLHPEADQQFDKAVGQMANLTTSAPILSVDGMNGFVAMQQFQADLTAFESDQRVSITLAAMQQLARYLAAIPGRKNLIWFSGSFPLVLAPDGSQNEFQAMRNCTDQVRETNRLLAAARVAVYPVDARGLSTLQMADASYTPFTNTVSAGSGRTPRGAMNKPMVANDQAKSMRQLMQEEATMSQIAEETGGHEYINSNSFKDALANALRCGSSYYTLGYRPDDESFHDRLRSIQVRIDGGRYQLAYRNSYYAGSSDDAALSLQAAGEIVPAVMHNAPLSTQILFKARVLTADDPEFRGAALPAGPAGEASASLKGPTRRYVVDVTADPGGVAFTAAPGGIFRGKIEFVLIAYDAEGNRVNYVDKGFALAIPQAQFEHAMATGISTRLLLDLPPGQLSLRLAVHDLAAARIGSLEIPLVVQAPR